MKKFKVNINNEEFIVNIEEIDNNTESAQNLKQESKKTVIKESSEREMAAAPEVGEGAVLAPMPGNIIEVNAKKGESVEIGDTLMILEAMKMENEVNSDKAGIVKEIKVRAGDSVDAEDVLLVIE